MKDMFWEKRKAKFNKPGCGAVYASYSNGKTDLRLVGDPIITSMLFAELIKSYCKNMGMEEAGVNKLLEIIGRDVRGELDDEEDDLDSRCEDDGK